MEGHPKQADVVNIVGIVAIGLVGALGIYVSFVGLQAFYEIEAQRIEERRFAEDKSAEVRQLHVTHEADLEEYRRLDPNRGTYQLDIEQAMRLVVDDARAGREANLVPKVGPHDTPTVPPVFGRPPDVIPQPAVPAEGGEGAEGAGGENAAPADGAGADGEAAAPADGAGADGEAAAPADGAGADGEAAAPAADAADEEDPAAAPDPGGDAP